MDYKFWVEWRWRFADNEDEWSGDSVSQDDLIRDYISDDSCEVKVVYWIHPQTGEVAPENLLEQVKANLKG